MGLTSSPKLGRMLKRRAFLLETLCLAVVVGCGGGAGSRLKTVDAGSGSGPILFEVQNGTDAPINNLYLAKTEAVNAALSAKIEPGSAAEQELWGIDHLTKAALEVNGRIKVPVESPGQWDVRAVDRDGRYQHVAGLKLAGGGRYILELGEGGWRVPR
jgi:hypothetical protein